MPTTLQPEQKQTRIFWTKEETEAVAISYVRLRKQGYEMKSALKVAQKEELPRERWRPIHGSTVHQFDRKVQKMQPLPPGVHVLKPPPLEPEVHSTPPRPPQPQVVEKVVERQIVVAKPLTEHPTSDLVAELVNRTKIKDLLAIFLGHMAQAALGAAPHTPSHHARELGSRSVRKKPLPRVVIAGILPEHGTELQRRFEGRAEIWFADRRTPTKQVVEKATGADHTIVLKKYTSHETVFGLQAQGVKFRRVAGGLTGTHQCIDQLLS